MASITGALGLWALGILSTTLGSGVCVVGESKIDLIAVCKCNSFSAGREALCGSSSYRSSALAPVEGGEPEKFGTGP